LTTNSDIFRREKTSAIGRTACRVLEKRETDQNDMPFVFSHSLGR